MGERVVRTVLPIKATVLTKVERQRERSSHSSANEGDRAHGNRLGGSHGVEN